MENFGGGEGEPEEAVDDDEDAQRAPNEEASAIKGRRICAASGGARALSGPTSPKVTQAAGDLVGRKQNHQPDAENGGADKILDERVVHGAGI